jgi:hypothetical protein
VFTFELDAMPSWQQDHLHDALELDRPRFLSIDAIQAVLGGRTRVEHIPTPGDCTDGFVEAFCQRPRGTSPRT